MKTKLILGLCFLLFISGCINYTPEKNCEFSEKPTFCYYKEAVLSSKKGIDKSYLCGKIIDAGGSEVNLGIQCFMEVAKNLKDGKICEQMNQKLAIYDIKENNSVITNLFDNKRIYKSCIQETKIKEIKVNLCASLILLFIPFMWFKKV